MLMLVIGTTEKNGIRNWRTQYLNPMDIVPNCIKREYGRRIPSRIMKTYEQIWLNDKKYLHDPARFGIQITEADREKARQMTGGE